MSEESVRVRCRSCGIVHTDLLSGRGDLVCSACGTRTTYDLRPLTIDALKTSAGCLSIWVIFIQFGVLVVLGPTPWPVMACSLVYAAFFSGAAWDAKDTASLMSTRASLERPPDWRLYRALGLAFLYLAIAALILGLTELYFKRSLSSGRATYAYMGSVLERCEHIKNIITSASIVLTVISAILLSGALLIAKDAADLQAASTSLDRARKELSRISAVLAGVGAFSLGAGTLAPGVHLRIYAAAKDVDRNIVQAYHYVLFSLGEEAANRAIQRVGDRGDCYFQTCDPVIMIRSANTIGGGESGQRMNVALDSWLQALRAESHARPQHITERLANISTANAATIGETISQKEGYRDASLRRLVGLIVSAGADYLPTSLPESSEPYIGGFARSLVNKLTGHIKDSLEARATEAVIQVIRNCRTVSACNASFDQEIAAASEAAVIDDASDAIVAAVREHAEEIREAIGPQPPPVSVDPQTEPPKEEPRDWIARVEEVDTSTYADGALGSISSSGRRRGGKH